MVFRPKIDVLYALSLILAVAVPLTIVLTQPQLVTTDDVITAMVIIALCALFILFLVTNMRYEVPNNTLAVKALFFSKNIPLANIKRVTHNISFVSGPALSCKRLVIHYKARKNGMVEDRTVSISPKDREAFLAAIEQKLSDSI